MRAYGPGHAEPYGGRGGESASPDSQSEDDGNDEGRPASSADSSEALRQLEEELSSQNGSEDAQSPPRSHRQQPLQQPHDPAAFRPWTLPHVHVPYGGRPRSQRRKQRQQQRQQESEEEEGATPTIVVHSTQQQHHQQQPDVWTIRPRAGSGRTSLDRRRRYDSYVGTLDASALERLDEEILQSAVVLSMGKEEDKDEDGADVYGGRTPLPSQPRRRRPRQREEEDEEEMEEGELRVSPAWPVSTSSPRWQSGRERLCDEGMDVRGSQRLSVRSHHQQLTSPARSAAGGRRGRRNAYEEDEEEQDVLDGDDRDKDRLSHRLSRKLPASSASAASPAGARGGASPYQSPLRSHRAESVGGRRRSLAPPPDPTFRDPKMGPPQLEDGQIPTSDSSKPRRLESKWVGGWRGAAAAAAAADGAGEYEGEDEDAEGGLEWDGQGRPISMGLPSKGRHRGRDSGLGVGWLYGDGAEGESGGGEPGKRTLLHWLDQCLPRMKDEERIARAAVYLSDAIDTRPVRMRSGGKGALRAYRLHTRGAWMRLMQALAVTHLLLALWEPPRAGLGNDVLYHDSIGRHARTGAASKALQLLGLEMVLVLLFAVDLGLEIFALGVNGFFGFNAPMRVMEGKGRGPALQAKVWGQARFVLVVLFFADVCLSLDQHARAPRFSRPLRPLYLICLSETLKRWSVLLVRLLVQLRDVALGTGILLGLFSLLGLLLFSETGYYAASLPYLNFDDFLNSSVALYVLMTTQNFGALLNPAYTANPSASSPLYFFFFMAFVLVVVLFLAHLALPRVFWVYHSFQRKQAYDSRLLERLALVASFRCLDGPERKGWVDLSSFRSLLRYARPDIFDLRTGYERDAYCGATEHMFAQLARTHPGRIYAHEFLRDGLCEVVLTDYFPAVPTLEPGLTASEWHQRERARFRAILGSPYCDVVAMGLLLLCCFFLGFYGIPAVSKGSLRGFAYAVIVAFTAEIGLKIWAFGAKPFFTSAANALDAAVVGAAFSSLVAYAFAPPHSPMRESRQMANLCLLFLALRLVRLFPRCRTFSKFASAFRVLPFFLSSFALCVLLAYIWSMLGMAIFAPYADRVATVSAGGQQELQAWAAVDNFNCFWSASVTLFQVATTYDWYKIMYLWMDVTRTGWTALYFISFHLVANVLVFQLTAALFLDAFLSFHDKRWVEGEADEAGAAAVLPPATPECGGSGGPAAFGRVGDVGDGKRWSYKSEPSAPSPTQSEDVEVPQQRRPQASPEPRDGSMHRSASTPARHRGPLASPGAVTHSTSYTASVI